MAKTTPDTNVSTPVKTRKTRAAKPAVPAVETLEMKMMQTPDDSLNQLMAELNMGNADAAADEVIEPVYETPVHLVPTVDDLNDMMELATIEALAIAEPSNTPVEVVVQGDMDTTPYDTPIDPLTQLANAVIADATPATDAAEAAPKVKGKGGRKPKVKADETGAEPTVKAEAEPKVPKVRKFYSSQDERLRDNLGENLANYTVLTIGEGDLDEEAVKKCMDDTMALIRAMNKKEQKWAAKFIEFLAGKKAGLSEVTHRILKVLERDGQLTMGNEGNVFKDLISKPYSAGAARAMGGNNVGMLKDLLVIIPGEAKGSFVANPASLLLAAAQSKLSAVAV